MNFSSTTNWTTNILKIFKFAAHSTSKIKRYSQPQFLATVACMEFCICSFSWKIQSVGSSSRQTDFSFISSAKSNFQYLMYFLKAMNYSYDSGCNFTNFISARKWWSKYLCPGDIFSAMCQRCTISEFVTKGEHFQ